MINNLLLAISLILIILVSLYLGKTKQPIPICPYLDNIEKATLDNLNYRKVLYTTPTMQLVLMSLLPGEEIGEEVHHDVNQFFRFESGNGLVTTNPLKKNGKNIHVSDGDAIIIPQGTLHNVKNVGLNRLQLYSIYSPPQHPPGTVEKCKSIEEHH